RVVYTIDGTPVKTIQDASSFDWYMNQRLRGTSELGITVYDYAGNTEEYSQMITVYNFFGN
ncbi:MAG: hypothetical protein QCI00_07610, partial [Candidatus Thermoplasmatota archaeon]|nr:hypothetical protein [Candidatus Thermoplasmatota archaeon]